MVVYKCGNWNDDEEPQSCPLCGADVRDDQPRFGMTVSITCEGWQEIEQ